MNNVAGGAYPASAGGQNGFKNQVVLQARGLTKRFTEGRLDVTVLQGVDLEVRAGETLAIVGASGSGKSTLLHLLGALDAPTAGSVHLHGQNLAQLSAAQQGALRNQHLGFVYQFHHLLPDFNARENVVLPQLVADVPRDAAEARAEELLTALGLGHRLEHRPSQLSGGEQQRVAVARGLANRPKLVLADEPTGNLDEATSDKVLEQFLELVRGEGSAALVATHNERLAARMDRVVRLHDGKLD